MTYKDKKPDFESESIRAWVGDKKEVSSLKDKEEKNPLTILLDNGIELHLGGFTKVMNKNDKVFFAYKFKHDKMAILYYIPEMERTEEDNEVIEVGMALFRQSGYSVTDVMDSVQSIKDNWKHLEKIEGNVEAEVEDRKENNQDENK